MIKHLHPSLIFVYFLSVIAFTMCLFHPLYIAVSFAASLLLMLLIDKIEALKRLGFECVLFVLISFINPLFSTNGGTVLFTYFSRHFTLEALLYGVSTALVFLSALQWFFCFQTVFTEDKFFSLFSSRAPSLTLLMTMVFRLVPELKRRTERISSDRLHIGKGSGNSCREKLTAGIENLSALTGCTLDNAVDTAASMNARGYGSGRRTCFCKYRFKAPELFMLISIIAVDICIVVFSLKGDVSIRFYPKVSALSVSKAPLAAYILLSILPSIIHISELLKWHISISKI